MTINEYGHNLQRLLDFYNSGDLVEIAMLPAAIEMVDQIKERVVYEGKGTANNDIGEYSTKPIVVSKYDFAKPAAFKSKSNVMYLPYGYKQLREIQGLEGEFVNLKYTGQMTRDFQVSRKDKMLVTGIMTARSAQVYNENVDHYGLFYVATVEETTEFLQKSQATLNKITSGILTGSAFVADIT